MNIRNWFKMFIKTLLVGGVVTILTGLLIQWVENGFSFSGFTFVELLIVMLWYFGMGLLFSVISQMGYLAYLMVHRLGLSFFRSVWNPIQVGLIAFALFDLVYFRYTIFATEGEGIFSYFLVALLLLLAGVLIAYIKTKQVGKSSVFIPALFFMVFISIIEWFPALRLNDPVWLHLMIYPLFACNAYQLLVLPRYIEQSKQERMMKKGRQEVLTNKN